MSAGESANDQTARARAIAARYEARAARASRRADAWEKGYQGEVRTVELLAALGRSGYHRLDDRALRASGGNIDHLIVGPAGVFVVDAKNWSGELAIVNRTLRQNGRRRQDVIEKMRSQATLVADALDGEFPAHHVPVRPVAVFVGEAGVGGHKALDRVHLVDGPLLQEWVLSHPTVLSERHVEVVLASLIERFPPRVNTHPDLVPGDTYEPPTEMVVFLEAWRKHGHHRLYVKSADGGDIGYLDLRSGLVASASKDWEPVLAQLLPHYLQGDTPGLRGRDLSDESRGAIRRFLDSVLGRATTPSETTVIACYHWRNYGKNRLYLHLIAPKGEKRSLGWFDLDGGQLSAEHEGLDKIVGYCGHRYLAVSSRAVRPEG